MRVSLNLKPDQWRALDEIAQGLDCRTVECLLQTFAELLIVAAQDDQEHQEILGFNRMVN